MKKAFITSCLILGCATASAQIDTIYTNEKVIPCNIAEVTETGVKFKYPNEEHINALTLNVVRRIVFRSGRVQDFVGITAFKDINSPTEWESVSISNVEAEVRGLYKICDVSSKAKGTTELSNQERVKRRAIDKIKMQAAIMGANVVYLMQMRSDGNKVDWWSGYSNSAETSLSGVGYSTKLLKYADFAHAVEGIRKLQATEKIWLANSNASYNTKTLSNVDLNIDKVYQENGMIYIDGDIESEKNTKFRVTYFDGSSFYIAYQGRSGVTTYKIALN